MVDPDKYLGRSSYFPDVSQYVEEDKVRHIILLTSSSNPSALVIDSGELETDQGTKEASLVLADDALYIVTTRNRYWMFPYESIAGYSYFDRKYPLIILQIEGLLYKLKIAKRERKEVLEEGVQFIETKILESV